MLRRRIPTAIAAAGAALLLALVGAPAQAAVGDVVTISGTVLSDTGAPLAGQFVSVSAFPGGFASAITDETGFYQVDYTLVNDTDFVSVSSGLLGNCDAVGAVSGPGSYTSNCVVTTFYHFTISGTASTDDGSPHEPITFVGAYDHSGTAFGSGQIQPDGSYFVNVSFTAASDDIELTAPDGTVVAVFANYADGDVFTGYDFTYHPPATWDPYPATVSGTVTTKRGAPVEGAEVTFGQGGNGGPIATTVTAADGTYSLQVETYWNEEVLDGSDGFVSVDGTVIEFVENIAPDSTTVVDFRVGKSPVFEPWLEDVDQYGDGRVLVDVARKINKDGTAEIAACSEWSCLGANFDGHRLEYWGLTPSDNHVGSAYLVFRETSGPVAHWLRADPDMAYTDAADFGPRNLDGYAYFDVQGDGPTDFVAWADKNGVTTVWTWSANNGIEGVEETTVDGRLVSSDHLDLDAGGGEELVLVTRKGNTYSVTLVTEATGQPETVATGKGSPTVTFEDADGDQVFDIVVTYPDRHHHRHHCG